MMIRAVIHVVNDRAIMSPWSTPTKLEAGILHLVLTPRSFTMLFLMNATES